MSNAVMEVIRQAKTLSASEKLEVAMALLAETQQEIGTQMPRRTWREIRGRYAGQLNGEDAQAWVNRLREEWDEREKQWNPPS